MFSLYVCCTPDKIQGAMGVTIEKISLSVHTVRRTWRERPEYQKQQAKSSRCSSVSVLFHFTLGIESK